MRKNWPEIPDTRRQRTEDRTVRQRGRAEVIANELMTIRSRNNQTIIAVGRKITARREPEYRAANRSVTFKIILTYA